MTPSMLVVLVAVLAAVNAVPLSMVMNSPGIVNPNAISEDNQEDDDDDFTTHTLERLSSAATCLVAGVEYTHGQQIYRRDQCEFCLCLDGEMFCWWQECPPALEGPCKDRPPFSPCQNGAPTHDEASKQTTKMTTMSTAQPLRNLESEIISSTDTYDVDESSTETTDYMSSQENSSEEATSTEAPKFCTIMGRRYNVGERLPHDTGNCVECICGAGAQITCSPHQCAPPGEEINDYRPPGLRSAQPDVF